MAEKFEVQNKFLDECLHGKRKVAVFLVSGIKLTGVITAFDTYTVHLDEQIVYKHAISTIGPLREARIRSDYPNSAAPNTSGGGTSAVNGNR